ncbi:MAG: hypothetical protein LUC29_07920, partial [Acidaminococcaceae bacterium]|nr:hypothetical protein [Acidaminococcaceae bacterium]
VIVQFSRFCLPPYRGDLYIIAFPAISVNTFFVTFFIFFDDTPGSVGKAFRLTTSHFPVIFSQNFMSLALSSIQNVSISFAFH